MPTFVRMTVEGGLRVKHYGTWYKAALTLLRQPIATASSELILDDNG
jgi:hypothetical protein